MSVSAKPGSSRPRPFLVPASDRKNPSNQSARDTCQQIRHHPFLSDPTHPHLRSSASGYLFSFSPTRPLSESETVWLVGSLNRRSKNITSNRRWRRHRWHHSSLTSPDFAAPDRPRLSRFLILRFTFDSTRVAGLHELSSRWLDPERYFFFLFVFCSISSFLFARFASLRSTN
jgi:hypothetical protein